MFHCLPAIEMKSHGNRVMGNVQLFDALPFVLLASMIAVYLSDTGKREDACCTDQNLCGYVYKSRDFKKQMFPLVG